MKKENYIYVSGNKKEGYLLYNKDTQNIERFQANKDFSGWTLPYRNTRLEFCSSFNDTEMLQFVRGLKYIHGYGEQHPSFKYAYNVLIKIGKFN